MIITPLLKYKIFCNLKMQHFLKNNGLLTERKCGFNQMMFLASYISKLLPQKKKHMLLINV